MTKDDRAAGAAGPLTATDFHVLLVLVEAPLYGYAIMKAVEEQSSGRVSPEIGSLYRVLARLMDQDLVEEADPEEAGEAGPHPGLPRRYYRLTPAGLSAARVEARRLEEVLELVRARHLLVEGEA